MRLVVCFYVASLFDSQYQICTDTSMRVWGVLAVCFTKINSISWAHRNSFINGKIKVVLNSFVAEEEYISIYSPWLLVKVHYRCLICHVRHDSEKCLLNFILPFVVQVMIILSVQTHRVYLSRMTYFILICIVIYWCTISVWSFGQSDKLS